ncbi:MAG: PrsW family intramembrane metalloprotease [Ruminiclostridium sp.]|nr:PrsW family intramembrane metalloprotease [Ruminiclostridium sp.]
MEQISEILFICIVMPMIPMLFVLPDKKSRLFVGYLMVGSLICLMAGALNLFLLQIFNGDMLYVTTTITPISEEVLKAIPVLYLAIFFTDDRETLLSASFALGVGFAILEDAVILAQNPSAISLGWAFTRVVGAALMHGACTAMVGMGMSYIRKRRKLFFCGTVALLIAAILFHATFNVLVQSSFRIAAFLLPMSLYLPVIFYQIRQRKKKK